MRIGFIGAGRVGFSLGGVPLSGYYSRHPESAQEAALFTGTKAFDSVEGLAEESDVLFLTVPDDTISVVYQSLRASGISGKVLCHRG